MKEGESAIRIWAPIITKQCPECENSPNYHEKSDCGYDETLPEERSKGLVGFKPAPVFDVTQTGGEPLLELDTEATGDAGDLVDRLTDAADLLDVTVRIVPEVEWTHGEAKGICEQFSLLDMQPRVEVRDRENNADLARTLRHRAVETRGRGRGRRLCRRAVLRARHEWVGVLPGYMGVGRSRRCSGATRTDQSDDTGAHRNRTVSTRLALADVPIVSEAGIPTRLDRFDGP